jgi:LemA protein
MKRAGCFIGIAVIVLLVLGVVGWFMGTYNSLVSKDQAVEAQWGQVETQYQRRFDLIPNLVNSVKGLMAQEQAIFNAIAEARTKYGAAATVNEKAEAASQVESALGRLLVVMENYPEIRSTEAVINLMDELAGTENRISVERRRYNELVQQYNTSIKTVPTNFIAGMFGFGPKAYFESVSGADAVPKVEL